MHAKSQGSCERAGLSVNYEMEIPDNEMEDSSDEMLDPENDVTDGEESDGDVGDMSNLLTSCVIFRAMIDSQKNTRSSRLYLMTRRSCCIQIVRRLT
jgi:hypothetical protein